MVHLVLRGSDCPFIVHLEKNPSVGAAIRQKVFRFEAMWAKENTCEEVIRTRWSENAAGGADVGVFDNLQQLRVGLLDWDLTTFGNVRGMISKLRMDLDKLQLASRIEQTVEETKRIRFELENLLDKEEMMWRQRGKAQWILEGDKNTAFFHS